MPLPTKKALPVFLYTKDVKLIDVVPETKTATYEIGDLISYSSVEIGTGGYYQGTEISVVAGEKTAPGYTGKADLKFLGVMAEQYPPNFFLYQDVDGQLDLADYTASPVSFAGSLERMTVCVMPNIVLVDFWNSEQVGDSGQVIEVLISSDIWADVFVSQTAGTDIGKAGKASLARSNPNSSGEVAIGKLLGIPISGGRYGYVMLDPLSARL